MGRKKIEIKKINCPIKRRETSRKRSKGILKKIKELAILCDTEVGVTMFSPTGKREHFSNRPRTEQVLQQIDQNCFPNVPEEVMTDLQVTENAHMPLPIQQMQVENEAGKCADYRDELKFGSSETHLFESEEPSSSSQQVRNGQAYLTWTRSTNPSPGTLESVYWHNMPMQQSELWAAPQVQMQRPVSMQAFVPRQFRPEVREQYGASDDMWGPLVGGRDMPFSEGVQPSSSSLPLKEAGTNEDQVLLY